MDTIRLDYTNALADAVGGEHGLTPADLETLDGPSRQAIARLAFRRDKDLRWMDLPYASDVRDQILEYAGEVQGRFENIVVLGIGGSALGNRALHSALSHPFHDLARPAGKPRLFVLDNVDPDLVGAFLETIEPEKTLFNVISKSGGTAETMSQFMIVRERLIAAVGEARAKEHIVCTTAAESGILRKIVEREGYRSFIVPEGVGGRFSVLSPVGLLSSALIGIDIEALCAGAAHMDERCRSQELLENPALVYAGVQWAMQIKKQKPIAVTFAYGHRLRDLADWYAQLLGESIGKRHALDDTEIFAGPTPVSAVGVTDQHSQVQLYVEGPYDKWFTLLSIEEHGQDVTIPHAFGEVDGVSYLGGRTLGELFAAERDGTRIALTEASRPNVSLVFPRVDAHTVGQYFYLMETAVAVMGEHYHVDAFDQPGVEAGKVAAYALMGRAGYEDRRAEIEAGRGGSPRII